MRTGLTIFHAVLLGSALAVAALTQAGAANLSRADQERLSAFGKHASVSHATSDFRAVNRPGT